jgi:hypothetical protein
MTPHHIPICPERGKGAGLVLPEYNTAAMDLHATTQQAERPNGEAKAHSVPFDR